ncbi:MAG: fucose isomerase [Clostridia bacterium]|nr:fucose isomerase [Clostridia bacterium]
MLNGISKILTGDMLKVLCDMGHGDVLVIGDANFPGETLAKSTTYGKLIRCPGIDVAGLYDAICDIFPIDVDYSEVPAAIMQLTEADMAKGEPEPEAWADYRKILHKRYPDADLVNIDRFEFYEKTKKAYVIIQTGEERKYGNLMLVKGCVM